MFVSKPNTFLITILFLLFSSVAYSAIPLSIPYAGTLKVDGERFNGEGFFKFAIVNADCGIESDRCRTIWSNDRTSVKGSEPESAIISVVNEGNYKILLGDVGLTNMVELSKTSFDNGRTLLRIWFNDGINGSQLLTPDQPFTSIAYAYHAGIADTVSAGAIGVNEIDSTQVQRRGIVTQCLTGEVVSGIDESGEVQCVKSLATNNFVAGDGISFKTEENASIVISANVRNTIAGTCQNGAISAIDDNGNISCTSNTALSAGEGISITEGVISASSSFTSAKVVSAVNASNNINAHHQRYSDDEAVAAINASTSVIAHHDRFTNTEAVAAVNAAGNAIEAHHPRYSDGEVITAINANSDSISAHHNRFTNVEAVAAVNAAGSAIAAHHPRYSAGEVIAAVNANSDSVAAHHNRYTDQEAIDAIGGFGNIDANSLAGVNAVDIARTDSNENFANATLYIDADNNRVGFGSTTPTEAVDVEGNVVAQSFRLKQARTGYLNIPANTFPNIRRENGWEIEDGSIFISPFTTKESIYAYAQINLPISLPNSVEITRVSCDFDLSRSPPFPSNTNLVAFIGFELKQYEKGSTNQFILASERFENPISNVGVQAVFKDVRDEVSGIGLLLDSSVYRYALKIELNSFYASINFLDEYQDTYVRIHGCDIEYLERSL